MGRAYNLTFICACFVFTTLFVSLNADENEAEDESLFTYSIRDENGPENWGNLDPKWKLCGTGKFQSPIDLSDKRVKTVTLEVGGLKRTYKSAPAVIKNRGHDIMVEWEGDAGGVIINGTEYKLLQGHWHTPSEHTLNGRRFHMELHLVHTNSIGQIAVIGVLYKLGKPDRFLAKLLDEIRSVELEDAIHAGKVDPWKIQFGKSPYYRYMGSLTVPPCTEGVLWTVLTKVRTVSQKQIRALRNAVHDDFETNARPTQRWEGKTAVPVPVIYGSTHLKEEQLTGND